MLGSTLDEARALPSEVAFKERNGAFFLSVPRELSPDYAGKKITKETDISINLWSTGSQMSG